MKKTKTNFKLTLDNWYNEHFKNSNRYFGNIKRGYGSYLYTQDRVKFDLLYTLWEVKDTKQEFESKG